MHSEIDDDREEAGDSQSYKLSERIFKKKGVVFKVATFHIYPWFLGMAQF